MQIRERGRLRVTRTQRTTEGAAAGTRDSLDPAPPEPPSWRRRIATLLPILVIVGILAIVAISGFGGGSGRAIDEQQVAQEVRTTLAEIPQHGRTLGSPQGRSPSTLFADLECPTVRLFAVDYLPRLIADWVRPGLARLEYHSLETRHPQGTNFFPTGSSDPGCRQTEQAVELLSDFRTRAGTRVLRLCHQRLPFRDRIADRRVGPDAMAKRKRGPCPL